MYGGGAGRAGYSEKDRQISQSYGADSLVGWGVGGGRPKANRIGQLLANAIEKNRAGKRIEWKSGRRGEWLF